MSSIRFERVTRFLCTAGMAVALLALPAAQRAGASGASQVAVEVAKLQCVPVDGAVQLGKDASGGVCLLSSGAPSSVLVESPDLLREQSAVAVSFFFRAKTKAGIRFTATVNPIGLERFVTLEEDRGLGPFPADVSLLPGVHTVAASEIGNLAQRPFMVVIGATGSYDVTLEYEFQANIPYRIVFYARADKGDIGAGALYDVFVGASDKSVEPEPLLKLIPPFIDPGTGCGDTVVFHLTEAYTAELKARRIAKDIADSLDTSDLSKLITPKPEHDERVREYLKLSKLHLECAQKLITERQDLDAQSKQFASDDVQQALDLDDEAIERLDIENPDVKDPLLQQVGQLALCANSIDAALAEKRSAGTFLPEGFETPTLPAGDVGAPDPMAALDVVKDSLTRTAELAGDLSEELEEFRRIVKEEGAAGLRRIVASNQEPKCLEFLRATILAELQSQADELERLNRLDLTKKARKIVRTMTKRVKRGGKKLDQAATKTGSGTAAAPPGDGGKQDRRAAKQASNLFVAALISIRRGLLGGAAAKQNTDTQRIIDVLNKPRR